MDEEYYRGDIAETIRRCLLSFEETDYAGDRANMVDALFQIAKGLDNVADAIRSIGNDKG